MQGAQWGNNNYVAYPDDVQAFLYNVTLDDFEFDKKNKTIKGYYGSGEVVVIPPTINGIEVEKNRRRCVLGVRKPNEHHNPQYRDQYRKTCILWMHRSNEHHNP